MQDSVQLEQIEAQINKIINHEMDSVRIYHLGKSPKNKAEVLGVKIGIEQDGTLIL